MNYKDDWEPIQNLVLGCDDKKTITNQTHLIQEDLVSNIFLSTHHQ